MALVESRSCSHHGSIHSSQKLGWAPKDNHSPFRSRSAAPSYEHLDQVNLASDLDGLHLDGIEALAALQSIKTWGCSGSASPSPKHQPVPVPQLRISDDHLNESTGDGDDEANATARIPFRKWVASLRRRTMHRSSSTDNDDAETILSSPPLKGLANTRTPGHHRSPSGSSFGFVSAVRSVSVSLASVSAVTRSRNNANRSRGISRTDHSSRASASGPRFSEDSADVERARLTDDAAVDRSLQRRRILEELISTEEGYIGDVRFLMNVYVTILASVPTLSAGLRSSINGNLSQIIELHEEILGGLHRAVPHSEYTQLEFPSYVTSTTIKSRHGGREHRRWASLDAVPECEKGKAHWHHIPGIVSDPQVAAQVSKLFAKKMNRFFIYEEYGAKYEMMIKDIASAHKTMPEWETYQKGLEALASTLGSDIEKSTGSGSKKSLTIGDLLVKPIQRICKYPLLFAELLKYTPVADCPNSHMEVENALIRLREATAEINRATNDTRMKSTLEKTWLLQDRLVFPKRQIDAASKNLIRSFGRIRLCGALHACWQTRHAVEGQYLVCLLYGDVLCLATAGKVEPIYTIQACIDLHRARLEEVDNGRGLQCHTAPFSWKLVFECDHQLYEVILTACTPKEELEWRARLGANPKDDTELPDSGMLASLELDIKSLGTVFGKPGTIARRISIHRATTVGSKSPLCQVVLKNTTVMREGTNSAAAAVAINRSQSLLTTNSRIPVLAPARGERARLEALLADVWSRDILPLPGMTTRSRSEHLVRTSASTVMRKLSVASIASSFNKRSGSVSYKGTPDGSGANADSDGSASEITSLSKRNGPAGLTREINTSGYVSKAMGPQSQVRRSRYGNRTDPVGFESTETHGGLPDYTTSRIRQGHASDGSQLAPPATLRTSSMNSALVSSTHGTKTTTPWSVAKENTYQLQADESRIHGRWAHLLKGEGKSHMLRSIFG